MTTKSPPDLQRPDRRRALGALAVTAAAGAGLLPGRARAAARSPIGFIYVGPRMDYGYNTSMDLGRQYVEKTLQVKTMSQENIPESAEVMRVMEKMIRAGCEIIFPTSYGYLDYAIALGKKYPKVTFLHAGGLKTSANVGTYFANSDDAMYLAGMAAGGDDQERQAGLRRRVPDPAGAPQHQRLHAGRADDEPEGDHPGGLDRRLAEPGQGGRSGQRPGRCRHRRDRRAGRQPHHARQDRAEARHLRGGQGRRTCERFAAKAYLTGASWNWGPMMAKLVQEIWAGTWKPSHVRGRPGRRRGGARPAGQVGARGPGAADREGQGGHPGRQAVVWKGPIVDQDGGKTTVAAGKPMALRGHRDA